MVFSEVVDCFGSYTNNNKDHHFFPNLVKNDDNNQLFLFFFPTRNILCVFYEFVCKHYIVYKRRRGSYWNKLFNRLLVGMERIVCTIFGKIS